MTQASTNQFLEERKRTRRFFVRFIEWVEGPNYPAFLAENREEEFRRAALRIDREERVSDFANYWLCTPLT